MKSPTASSQFFGVDLRSARRDWENAFRGMTNWPLVRWLSPKYAVRLSHGNGLTADYLEGQPAQALHSTGQKSAKYSGVLLGADQVLWKTLLMPDLEPDMVKAALSLQVSSLTPFSADDTVWDHVPFSGDHSSREIQVVISSRKVIGQALQAVGESVEAHDRLEVWVRQPDGQGFLVLNGFGERIRRKATSRARMLNVALVLLFVTLLAAIAIVPTFQLRARAIQAKQDYLNLSASAQPAVKQRELLVQLEKKTTAVTEQVMQSLAPDLILARLTKLLPDDTYITNLQLQSGKVVLTGQTTNSSALMQLLGTQEGIKNVRAPTAAFKARGSDRETFTIELTMDVSHPVTSVKGVTP